jgi:wyosine [tRNA(Phe)-imidazoG37] synthetase (radical SAM superfamily)
MPRLKNLKYIYGPVPSWRLGRSLGIDVISGEKICSFDCIYCQLGPTYRFSRKRKVFVPTKKIIDEIKGLPTARTDYITFSGSGEPTLAKNLGSLIKAIRKIRKEKIAVLTNGSLIDSPDVRRDLALADYVSLKLDASSQGILNRINRPKGGIRFENILEGIKKFKATFKGTLALQLMFVDENKSSAGKIALLAAQIKPDEIQINTPLRPCGVRPLSRKEISRIKKRFLHLAKRVVSVYGPRSVAVEPIDAKATLKRRPRAS